MSQIYNPYEQIGVNPPTTSTTTCNASLVSVTLSAGQSFILPPGATLVGASDINSLQSDCADLLNLEQFECYVCAIPIAAEDGGATTASSQYWEANTGGVIAMRGYNFNGADYGFSSQPQDLGDQGHFNGGLVDNALVQLKNDIPGIIATSYQIRTFTDKGSLNFILIKTFPSIADNLKIIVATSLPEGEYNLGVGHFPFIKKSDSQYPTINWGVIGC
jgi:hypothetical protein